MQYIYLDAIAELDPTFREELVKKAIKQALGVTGEEGDGIDGSAGLLGLRQRQFGQHEYATRIEATIQNVEGVVWAQVNALSSLGYAENPLTLHPPSVLNPPGVVTCEQDKVLSLHKAHLIPYRGLRLPKNGRMNKWKGGKLGSVKPRMFYTLFSMRP